MSHPRIPYRVTDDSNVQTLIENLAEKLSKAKGGKGSGKGTGRWVTINGNRVFIDNRGTPHYGADARRASQGKNPEGKGSVWKAKGTYDEAEAFAANSKVQGVMYHGTSVSDGNSIGKSGFRLSDGGYGKGIYLTKSDTLAKKYASVKSDNPTVLKTRVNMKKPFYINMKERNGSWDSHRGFLRLLRYARENRFDGLVVEGLEVGGEKGVSYVVPFSKKSVMIFED